MIKKPNSKSRRRQSLTAVLFIGDTHVGSKWAVCPNGQSTEGIALFKKWGEMLNRVKQVIKSDNSKLILALGGDLVEGHHHGTMGVWGNYKQQRDAAVELLLPLATIADDIIALPGTEAHAGDDGENDRQVAQELGARIISPRHRLLIDGKRLDWTHHGIAVSQNGWMDDGGMIQAIRRVENASFYQHTPPPDLIVSHHAHRSPPPVYVRGVGAAVCGCWQLSTPHGSKIAARSNTDIGVLYWRTDETLPERWLYNDEEKWQTLSDRRSK